jgi:phage terminase large subunit-like protein
MIKKLMHDSPRIKQKLTVTGKLHPKKIIFYERESFMEPLSADSDKQDGFGPHCSIIDEYHAHKTDALLEVIESGTGQRKQPLTFIITTAGFNIEGPCYKERSVSINVLEGTYQNDQIFSIIFTLDEDDDWNNPEIWIKSNPLIGQTPTWEYMNYAYSKALEGSSKEINFLTKNLNIWTSSAATWIKQKDYKKVIQNIDIKSLLNRICTAGLDLASAEAGDIVAYELFFPKNDEIDKHILYHYFFISEEKAKDQKKGDGVDYFQWVRDGYLIMVPGNTIDYRFVKSFIMQTAEDFQIDIIEYDRWNSSQIVVDLIDEGIPMEKFGQGFASMSAPTKQLEYWIKREEIAIHDNPVFHWMMRNVALKFDPAGNVKIDKEKSQNKVDGPVAAAMSIGGYLTGRNNENIYKGNGPQEL